MSQNIARATRATFVAATMALFASTPDVGAQSAQRVYLSLADSVPVTVPEGATAIGEAFKAAGWTVLANHAVGTERDCPYSARVVVAYQPSHGTQLLSRAPTAPFAIITRIAVFDDERGVHVAMVNPLSLERTMVAESGLESLDRALIADVSKLVVGATRGRPVDRPYGQSRDRGLIGKTMGIMAGGPFPNQVKVVSTTPASSAGELMAVADKLWDRLRQPSAGEWQLHGVYRLDLPDRGVIVLGVSGAPMETRAFRIVGAGSDDSRSRFKCAGIAHAAAFPLEVVIRKDGAEAKVEIIDAMFRMKMYFEDAGRMKFARNMGMPGSIADELKARLEGKP